MKKCNRYGIYQLPKANMLRVMLCLSIILAMILPSVAASSISFTYPTPVDNAILNTSYANINTTITDPAGSTALINWDNSLLGWWRMNEAAGGALVEDFSGNGYDGTWNGNVTSNVTSGKFGNGLDFDGVNDNVSIPPINAGTVHSASVWINFRDTDDGVVIGRIGPPLFFGYLLYINQTHLFYNSGYEGGNDYVIVPHGGLTSGTFYNIVTIRNGTSVSFYKDGVQLGTTQTLKTNNPLNGLVSIGMYENREYPTNMILDEVRIWNRVLSPQEIIASYDAGAGLYNNFTNLENGNYTYEAYVQNPSGDVSQTGTRTLTIQVLSLESYNNTAHIDNYFNDGESTVFMVGTGFTPGTGYKVAYYDGTNIKRSTDSSNASVAGNLLSSYTFQSGTDSPGIWHAQVIYATGSATGTYSYNGPGVLIEDNFIVAESAIPEFPAGMAIPLAASLIIFVYLRNRISNGKK